MKKIIFSFLIISIFLFIFFACENLLWSNTESSTAPVTSVSIELPEFYVCDLQNSVTTIEEDKIADYYNKAAYLPEDEIEEEYIDIRPMVYKELQEGTVDAVTITENEGATWISLTSPQSNLWDIFLASKNIWNFEANTNYKVSFEAKSTNDDEIILVELKDSHKTERGGNICASISTEFKSYSFETGSYNKAWRGHLQVAIGFLTSEIYIKNLKIEKIKETSLPFGIYLGSKDDRITTEKVENKPIIEEQKTETKQDNTCKLKKDIECKIYNKGIEKGLTKEQSLLLVAISKHETGNWTSKAFKEKHNFGGIMSSSTGQLKVYKNQNEGLEGFVNLLKTKYFEKGLNTIEKIGAKYCPVGSKNDTGVNKYWIPNVTQFYNEYLQQM